VPFYKFGNYGEGYIDTLDWSTARVQAKIDGSLIKVNYDGIWHVSTNNLIDARKAPLDQNFGIDYNTFYDLFMDAAKKSNLDFNRLKKNCTYMFELTSPYNKVVVRYDNVSIHHLGARNNDTLEEFDCDIGVPKPKSYSISTLKDCIDTANTLSDQEEGFVVVDANWHRNKIKSPQYVAKHYVCTKKLSRKKIVWIMMLNESDEFLASFPDKKPAFDLISSEIDNVCKYIDDFKKQVIHIKNKKKLHFTIKDFIYEDVIMNTKDIDIPTRTFILANYTTKKILWMLDSCHKLQLLNVLSAIKNKKEESV
jgi:hypothetical protein